MNDKVNHESKEPVRAPERVPVRKNAILAVPQPERLSLELFPHQRVNIKTMEDQERDKFVILPNGDKLCSNIGILADPPGTGKTPTIVGLVCRGKLKWESDFYEFEGQMCSNVDGSIRILRTTPYKCINTTLVVVPLSICGQWEEEIEKSDLTYKIVKQQSDMKSLENYEIVVCTSTMFNALAVKYREHAFLRFVYDEMDSAYIANMEEIRANHIWLMSATFQSVIGEINRSRRKHFLKRCFFSILGDEYSKDVLLLSISVTSTEKIRALRPVPKEAKTIYYQTMRSPVIDALGDHMDEQLIEMIDAGNIKDAIKHLGGSDSENIIELLMARAHKKLSAAEEKADMYKGKQKEKWLGLKDEAEKTLKAMEEKVARMLVQPCSLCDHPMVYPTLFTCCQQICCGKCSALVRKKICPFCHAVESEHIYLVKEIPEEEIVKGPAPSLVNSSDKFTNLVKIAGEGKKVLLFASHNAQFPQIAACLKGSKITYSLIQGTVNQRQTMIDGYVKGDTTVLILNSRMNGAGLNLQYNTTDLVFWQPMPENLSKQIVGRVLRYGLKHEVTIHKFFSKREENTPSEGDLLEDN